MDEPTLYPDSRQSSSSPAAVKRSLHVVLDLDAPNSKHIRSDKSFYGLQEQLTTPDIEQLIMDSNSVLTAQQEEYAKGVFDPISQQSKPPVPIVVDALDSDDEDKKAPVRPAQLSSRVKNYTTLVPQSQLAGASQYGQMPTIGYGGFPLWSTDELDAQTVPNVDSSDSGILLSAVDMDDQERQKLDRKRERNRLAAQKCRTRKLQQISTLQSRVEELKAKNTMLEQEAAVLRREVNALRQRIVNHTNSGCTLAARTPFNGRQGNKVTSWC